MFKDNKIIIVDNEERELNTLATVFWEEGVACKALLYDQLYNMPLKGVRVAFFDVNLTSTIAATKNTYDYNSDNSLRDIFHNLANALAAYIAPDNGPYALIFWTNNQRLINNFKEYMNARGNDYTCPTPIQIGCLDKSEFFSSDKSENDSLNKKIELLIQNSPVSLLYELEKKANQAITNSINDIHSITLDHNVSWLEPNNNLKQIFIEIATNTIGQKHVKSHFWEGLVAGLNPMINFHMEQLILNGNINCPFPISKKDTKSSSMSTNNKHRLNAIFHINNNASPCERGAVYLCNDDFIASYLGNSDVQQKWIKRLIGLPDDNNLHFEKNQKIDNILANTQFIAVEMSPACDYSNKKDRLQKFIIGIRTIEIDENLLVPTKIPAYSFFPNILFNLEGNSEIFQLIFNFNYTVSIPKSNCNESIGDLLFSLKKEYMDMLTTKYANHISRIGITEFR